MDLLKYRPSYFLTSLGTDGAFSTVIKLLAPGRPPSDGFVRLWKEGHLELSVEALILESEWKSLFDDEVLTVARKRLRAVGYSINEPARVAALPALDAIASSNSTGEADEKPSFQAQTRAPLGDGSPRRVWKVSGPPENFLVAIQRKHWALNEKNKNAWTRLKTGDILVFHSTRSSDELRNPPSVVIGFARVGPNKYEKEGFWWPTELSEQTNHWPYTFDLEAICLACAGLSSEALSTPLSIASAAEKREWVAILLQGALPISEIEREAKSRDPGLPSFPLNGSIAPLNDVYESVILGNPAMTWTLVGHEAELWNIEDALLSEEDVRLIDAQSLGSLLQSASAFEDPVGPSHESRTVKVRIESAAQKRRIAALENFMCQVCGYRQQYTRSSGKDGWIIHVDHIIDKAKGGGEEMRNLWVLCPNCHVEKTQGVLVINPGTHEVTRLGELIDITDNHLRFSREILSISR
jgi:hypothetical protein